MFHFHSTSRELFDYSDDVHFMNTKPVNIIFSYISGPFFSASNNSTFFNFPWIFELSTVTIYPIYKWISLIFTFMLCTYLNSGSPPSLVIGSLKIIIFSNKKTLRSLPFVFAFPSTTKNSSFTTWKRKYQLISGKKRTSQNPCTNTAVKFTTFKSSRNICLEEIVDSAQSR